MKVLFCGGGTLGPVTPLVAVLRQMRARDPWAHFAWVGTSTGPEGGLIEAENVSFHALPVAKLPRYLSREIFAFPFRYLAAKRMARRLIEAEKPDVVVTAGGYSGVPIIREAARRGIACALHQLDYEPGLSNRLVANYCRSVTTSFRYSYPPFGVSVLSEEIETPCRFAGVEQPISEEARKKFGIDSDRRVILVIGGGTGALVINQALADILDALLLHADVIHSTGPGKMQMRVERSGYHCFELLNEEQMRHAFAIADIVVARSGLGTLSELAALSKAAIVIPIPNSHQEANARAVERGIVWLHQTTIGFSDAMRNAILDLLKDEARRIALGAEIHHLLPTDTGHALAERWMKLVDA